MTKRTASCSCGQLSIEVQGESLGVGVCHCLACQRRTGSVFAALACFAAPFRVIGNATEYVRVGDQGTKYTFRFCPVCGTNLFHTEEGCELSYVNVAVGAFADPSFPAPQDSVYECRKHSWVQLPPGTQGYEKDPT
ncbi:GFA family protein [Dyella lipolytica]|uniref:GFA family protein n=1 Tax=Dyella lipolytica TaxID=1867835 RepID=A0ABW8ITW4_9GAMM|nr:GFA family protein [Dyella lipolytica]